MSRPEDLVAGVLGQVLAPNLVAGSIRRIREVERDGAARLDAGQRGAYHLESGGTPSTSTACVPTDVERVVADGEVGIVRTGAFTEEAWAEIPVGPRGAVTVLDV